MTRDLKSISQRFSPKSLPLNINKLLDQYLCRNPQVYIFKIGDDSILKNQISALICSVRCPGDLILKSYDMAQEFYKSGKVCASGFHSPIEKDCLNILLRGDQPVVICPGRGIHKMRILKEWRPHIESGRLLILSPFGEDQTITKANLSQYRNKFVAAIASDIYIPYASPKSKTMKLAELALSWKKKVYTFDHPSNEQLISMGAQPMK